MSSRIDEIREREQKATKGPWITKPTPKDVDGWPTCTVVAATAAGQGNKIYAQPDRGISPPANCDFIANAREDIPFLLGEVERLQHRLDAAESALESIGDWYTANGKTYCRECHRGQGNCLTNCMMNQWRKLKEQTE